MLTPTLIEITLMKKDVGNSSGTSMVKDVLEGRGGEEMVERRTQTRAVRLPHRLRT